MYYTQSIIANDPYITERIRSCYAQEVHADPVAWTYENRYVWAASPGWDAKWEYALASEIENPGSDSAVITDGDILATVQSLIPNEPETLPS